jgi:hypothetical protein
MDKIAIAIPSNMSKGKKSWEKRENFEDGSYKEIRVEEVDNGFIKSVTRHYKENGEWEYETKRTIHTENPMEEKSLADKLQEYLNDN